MNEFHFTVSVDRLRTSHRDDNGALASMLARRPFSSAQRYVRNLGSENRTLTGARNVVTAIRPYQHAAAMKMRKAPWQPRQPTITVNRPLKKIA